VTKIVTRGRVLRLETQEPSETTEKHILEIGK
jgi:hypothetical protein